MGLFVITVVVHKKKSRHTYVMLPTELSDSSITINDKLQGLLSESLIYLAIMADTTIEKISDCKVHLLKLTFKPISVFSKQSEGEDKGKSERFYTKVK